MDHRTAIAGVTMILLSEENWSDFGYGEKNERNGNRSNTRLHHTARVGSLTSPITKAIPPSFNLFFFLFYPITKSTVIR